MDDNNSRINFGCLDPEVRRIIACLHKVNCLTDNVKQCLDDCDEVNKKDILFCLLLNHTLSCATDNVQVCGLGVDGVTRTVQQDTHGTVSTLPNASAYCQAGQLFSVIEFANESVVLVFENPATNTKTMYLENVSGGIEIDQGTTPLEYQSTLHVDIRTDPGAVSDGTAVTPVNRNLGSSNASTIIVNDSLSSQVSPSVLSLTNHPTGEFSLDFRGQIIVPPGRNLIVLVDADLASDFTGQVVTTVTWFEL
jgi:hypothetical protein